MLVNPTCPHRSSGQPCLRGNQTLTWQYDSNYKCYQLTGNIYCGRSCAKALEALQMRGVDWQLNTAGAAAKATYTLWRQSISPMICSYPDLQLSTMYAACIPAADGQRVAVWRCLTAPAAADTATPAQAQQALLNLRQAPPRWAVVVSSGGHFAAAIFAMAPPAVAGRQQPKGEKPLFEVVAHKTFHRYVVRWGAAALVIVHLHRHFGKLRIIIAH